MKKKPVTAAGPVSLKLEQGMEYSKGIKAKNIDFGRNLKIAPDVQIEAINLRVCDNVEIQSGVIICGENVMIGKYSVIGKNNKFNVKNLDIGYKVKIEKDGKFSAVNDFSDSMNFGDFSFVGFNQNILVPEFKIGDYTSIHNSLLVNGYKPCILGHNCWVGQNSILNATETLKIGNNVRIGTQSQLWTHVASGELLEGCTLHGEHPLTIEDNVWIVGGAVISPNLIVKKGSIIMTGAVLTKNTEERHCYAGVPAVDVTDKIRAYNEVSLNDKFRMMKEFIDEFHNSTEKRYLNQVSLVESIEEAKITDKLKEYILIIKNGTIRDIPLAHEDCMISLFSLDTKEYSKRRTVLEEKFIRFNIGYRARFIPLN